MINIIAALMVCIAITGAGWGIQRTLNEVCPTVEEGTTFLHASSS